MQIQMEALNFELFKDDDQMAKLKKTMAHVTWGFEINICIKKNSRTRNTVGLQFL